MSLWIIIPVLLTVVLVVYTWMQRRYGRSGHRRVVQHATPLREETALLSGANGTEIPASSWWKEAGPLQQLQLALHLVKKLMPVWEKYTSGQAISYRAVPGGPLVLVQNSLLPKAVQELSLQLHGPLAGTDARTIHHYRKQFIDPVLALKDGLWVCSYPVKKIVLAVYYMLMSVEETPGALPNQPYATAAMQAVLECMEMSKLYPPEEVDSLLETYRNSLR